MKRMEPNIIGFLLHPVIFLRDFAILGTAVSNLEVRAQQFLQKTASRGETTHPSEW